ncbi:tetraspanin-3 [Pogona vitticeps]
MISKMKGTRYSFNCSPSLMYKTQSWNRVFARVMLTFLGFFLWGAAVALLFGGIFVILTYQIYRIFIHNSFFAVPGWLAITAAFLLFPTGALAIYEPVRNSRPYRGTLMYLFLVLLCLEASSAVMTRIYLTNTSDQLKNNMQPFFHRCNRTAPAHCGSEAVDTIHKQLGCCGLSNYTDWMRMPQNHLRTTRPGIAPESCCKGTHLDCHGNMSEPEKLFEEGCLKKLEERLSFVMQYMAWCCVVVGCLEILAALVNGMLMKEQPYRDFHLLESATFS